MLGAFVGVLGWLSDHPFVAGVIVVVIALFGALAFFGMREARREELEKSKKAIAFAEQEVARSRAARDEVERQAAKRAAERSSSHVQERQQSLARLREQAERLAQEIRHLQENGPLRDEGIELLEQRNALGRVLHELEDRTEDSSPLVDGALSSPRSTPTWTPTAPEPVEIQKDDLWNHPEQNLSTVGPLFPGASLPHSEPACASSPEQQDEPFLFSASAALRTHNAISSPRENPWVRISPDDLLRIVCDLLGEEGWRSVSEIQPGVEEGVSTMLKNGAVIGVRVLRSNRAEVTGSEPLMYVEQDACAEHGLDEVLVIASGDVGDDVRASLGQSAVMTHVIDADLLTRWNAGRLIFAAGKGLVDAPR